MPSEPSREDGQNEPVAIMIAAITFCAATGAIWLTRGINPLRGDSAEYLYFDPSRTIGYPAFLEAVRLLTGHVAAAIPFQIVLLAASLAWLGYSFHRLVRRRPYSIGFQLLLIANPGVWFASAFIMTEALSTALVAVWCAEVVRAMDPHRGMRFGVLATASALATTVRPSLIALFFGTAVLSLTTQIGRERWRTLIVTAGALPLAWSATPVAQWLVHGSMKTTSPLARGILQHTLYCAPKAISGDLDAALVEATAAPVRRYIDASPPEIQEQLRREYSTPLRFGSIIPALGRRHGLASRSAVDPVLAQIARDRVKANTACYARSVGNEYLRLTTFDTDPTAENASKVNAYLKSHPPTPVPQYRLLPGDDQLARQAASELRNRPAGLNRGPMQIHVVGDVPSWALLPLRLLHAAAALIGAAGLVSICRPMRRGRALASIAALGVTLHATLLITAVVEIGFYRYLVPCWPLVCVIVGVAVLALCRSAERRRARRPLELATAA